MRLVVVFTMSAVTIEIWPTEVPIWGLVLAIAIAIFYIVPVGMIQAITNQQIGLNVITELIAGYALPGRPIALMIFKTFGYIVRLSFVIFSVQHTKPYGFTPGDGTSVAIHVGHEARSLYESPTEEYVLVSDRCYGSGRHNTTGRTTVVRLPSCQVKLNC